MDVGAAEGVDRLLGVADEHEGGAVAAEGGPHDVPLDRVGVLELVDERDLVAAAQALAGDRAAVGVGQRVRAAGSGGRHR